MPGFDQTSDYFNPLPSFAVGLQLGQQIAQQRYQSEAMALAQKRQAMLESEELRKKVAEERDALRIQKALDEQQAFKATLGQNFERFKGEISPNDIDFEDRMAEVPRKALDASIPAMPPAMAARYLEQRATQDSQAARDDARSESMFNRQAAHDEMILKKQREINDAAYERNEASIRSREHIAELKAEAFDYNGSEDQFATQKLSAIMKKNNVGPDEAEVIARGVYRKYHKGGASEAALPEAIRKETDDEAILRQLQAAKEAKIPKVKIDGTDVTPDDSWFGGKSVEEMLKKYDDRVKIKGGTTKPSSGGSRVLKFDPKTGGAH